MIVGRQLRVRTLGCPLNLPFNTGSIVNEMDVELKVITPLLTNPNFLDIPAGSIHMYVTAV